MPDKEQGFVQGTPNDIGGALPSLPEIKQLSLDNVKDILSRSGADLSQIDLSKVKPGNIDLSQLGLDPSTMGLPDLAKLNLGGLDMRQVIGTVPKDMPGIHDNKELKELIKMPNANSSEVVGTLVPGTNTLKPIESADAIPFVQNKTPLTHAPVNVVGKWGGQGRWSITDEFGNVRIGSVDLPGIFSSMSISQDVEMESKEVKGRSGKAKQITGYSDAKISLSLILDSDDKETAYDKLVKIQTAFRSTDRAAIPKVMKIINKHVQARGISDVIFKSLNSSEGNGDAIEVSLEFEEFYPVIPVQNEKKADTPKTQTGAPANTQKAETSGAPQTPPANDTDNRAAETQRKLKEAEAKYAEDMAAIEADKSLSYTDKLKKKNEITKKFTEERSRIYKEGEIKNAASVSTDVPTRETKQQQAHKKMEEAVFHDEKNFWMFGN